MKRKVQVWIYLKDSKKDYRFLLLLTQPARGSFWQPVTGSMDEGESPAQAAEREAYEESGLTFMGPPTTIPYDFEYQARDGTRIREVGFALEVDFQGAELPIPRLDPHEHNAFRWVSSGEALQMIRYPSNGQMLQS